ncbi:uncharacterized protein LOC143861105 [Tasmannia lanceolata]|uniref:uncharacterized protein LOC143861105 n=1 Tax=Tasmannia lanceolata TaxID=3420 RepID=UPI004064BC95
MIQLLFSILSAEVAVVFLLMIKTPLRKVMIMGLDLINRGNGPLIVKTISAIIFVVLVSSLYSIFKIKNRILDLHKISPTDQILMGKNLLEASLMGFSLILALVIDQLHQYIRELRAVRKSMEAAKKQNIGFEDGKSGSSEERKTLDEEIATLRAKVKQLESEVVSKSIEAANNRYRGFDDGKRAGSEERKTLNEEIASLRAEVKQLESVSETRGSDTKAAESNAIALRKQSEGLLLEYDRLLEDNQSLRNQLQSLDHRLLSRSAIKKIS